MNEFGSVWISQAPEGGWSSIHRRPAKAAMCIRQPDGTYRVEDVEPEREFAFDSVPGDKPPSPEPRGAQVVFIPRSHPIWDTIFAGQVKAEVQYGMKLHRPLLPADLVIRRSRSSRANITIGWFRRCSATQLEQPNVHGSAGSHWLLFHPYESSGNSELSLAERVLVVSRCATAVQLRICQTPQALFIGLNPQDVGSPQDADPNDTFWDETFQTLSARTDITPATLLEECLQVLYRIILRDEHLNLSQIEEGLCQIDLEMCQDQSVLRWIGYWRLLVGSWRSYLHSRTRFPSQLDLVISDTEESEDGDESDHVIIEKDPVDGFRDVLTIQALHESLPERLQAVTVHSEGTFTALMATMSMIESEKAIREAESVGRLTELAFFFIPITLAAGIFGMNIREFSNPEPSVWMFVVTSIAALRVAYFVLYGWFTKLIWLGMLGPLTRSIETFVRRQYRVLGEAVGRTMRWIKDRGNSVEEIGLESL